jgi:hypothetical protein
MVFKVRKYYMTVQELRHAGDSICILGPMYNSTDKVSGEKAQN